MISVNIKKNFGSFSLDVELNTASNRIGILGASGCGKSMTLKSIAGILTPDEGIIQSDERVMFDSGKGINIKPQDRNIGYLFQNYALFPNMTVRKNIEAGVKGKKDEKRKKAEEMIRRFSLSGLEERYPQGLSGGQQQRVALARIMAQEPDIILLDEPFSALDVFLKEKLQRELFEMLADYDGIVIMVSHSRDEIYTFADSVLVMDNGQNVAFGKKEDIFRNPGVVSAARLTGCKNISRADVLDDGRLFLKDWGVMLSIEAEIPEGVTHIGIRAHDFVPVWDGCPDNAALVDTYSFAQFPFEKHYYIDAGNDKICWFVQRDMYEILERNGMPGYLCFPQDKLLFLK